MRAHEPFVDLNIGDRTCIGVGCGVVLLFRHQQLES
jgi:hypothetical protein